MTRSVHCCKKFEVEYVCFTNLFVFCGAQVEKYRNSPLNLLKYFFVQGDNLSYLISFNITSISQDEVFFFSFCSVKQFPFPEDTLCKEMCDTGK